MDDVSFFDVRWEYGWSNKSEDLFIYDPQYSSQDPAHNVLLLQLIVQYSVPSIENRALPFPASSVTFRMNNSSVGLDENCFIGGYIVVVTRAIYFAIYSQFVDTHSYKCSNEDNFKLFVLMRE